MATRLEIEFKVQFKHGRLAGVQQLGSQTAGMIADARDNLLVTVFQFDRCVVTTLLVGSDESLESNILAHFRAGNWISTSIKNGEGDQLGS